MMKKPVLKAKVSDKDFRDWIADEADKLARWVDLSVSAFAADPKAKAERLAKVRIPETGFQYFLETYLPHYVKGEHSLFHKAIFARVPEILAAEKGVRDLFIAPRGSSKSTHLSLGFALYCICLGYKRYILEVCDVYAQAALLIEAIKAELTENPRLANDFPDVTGQGRVWREGEIVTKNNIRVEGLGANQKLRGRRHGPYRPDLMFFDDLENDEAVRSPEQRKKLETWIKRAALKVGPPDGSMDVVWVGTVLHYDAVLVRAAKSPVWRVAEFQAVIQFPDRMDLWDQFEEVYQNDGEDAARAFYAERKADMDAGAIVNWPAIQPLIFLMLERASDHDSFATEYQNKPINEASPFKDLTFWVLQQPDLIHFGAIDPSLGKKGHGRDPSAILVGGFNRLHGTMDLLEASIRRRLPDIIISDVIAMQRQYRCLLWFVEAVQFQEFLRTTLMATAARQGVGISAVPVTPIADKDLRIERLQPPVAGGLIRLNKTQQTLIDQLQQWPNADHDDGPDCLDMLWQHTLEYAGGATAGASGGINTAANSSQQRLGGYRL
ncbi:phage terminase large subunit [Rhizobium pusense]|uniref:phage terminase large subunit n=1 Tax=Agrobacterium pusense TaxID=648995 RepID=UPI00244D5224|nr:phage terminase large subunit [Agrobacterium pusense]MDH1093825.1 phage terminase large subunit [Agrobacterium pusense]MDH1110279.1 phage terminase large subunit [Agrobacterium pusense]MDH2193721.1 phage terminase large subunit [Agrobacterium pusense]